MISERSLFLHFLRIFSAIVVVISHARDFLIHPLGHLSSDKELVAMHFMSLGGAAVLVFFFLSGYLVGGMEIERHILGSENYKKYFLDRVTRLWQVLLPALLFTYVINSFSCANGRYSLYCSASIELVSHAGRAPVLDQSLYSYLGSIFFLQPFNGNVFGGNGPLWSLSYEFWYYIIFYCILMIIFSFIRKKFSHGLFFFFPLSAIGASFLSFDWFLLGSVWMGGAISRYAITILDRNFLISNIGCMRDYKILKLTVFFVFPAMISVRFIPRAIIYCPILVFLLFCSIALSNNHIKIKKKKERKNLIVVGSELSFSLYLIHFPILALFSTYLTAEVRWNLGVVSITVVAASTVFCIFIAFLFASITERRLAYFRKKISFFYN
jgi:peptidoglycan/LPS O-acetylase OafA/YrhL